jgi:hypothetical protein
LLDRTPLRILLSPTATLLVFGFGLGLRLGFWGFLPMLFVTLGRCCLMCGLVPGLRRWQSASLLSSLGRSYSTL